MCSSDYWFSTARTKNMCLLYRLSSWHTYIASALRETDTTSTTHNTDANISLDSAISACFFFTRTMLLSYTECDLFVMYIKSSNHQKPPLNDTLRTSYVWFGCAMEKTNVSGFSGWVCTRASRSAVKTKQRRKIDTYECAYWLMEYGRYIQFK